MGIQEILEQAVASEASDIFLISGLPEIGRASCRERV